MIDCLAYRMIESFRFERPLKSASELFTQQRQVITKHHADMSFKYLQG